MSAQNLERLLLSRHALVIGAPSTPLDEALLSALGTPTHHVHSARQLGAALAEQAAADAVAIVFDASLVNPSVVEALVAQQCRGVVWVCAEPIDERVLQAARPGRLRFLGPRTAGFWHRNGLAAGAFAGELVQTPSRGIALIAQSGSIASAAIDWAAGRRIGFSWAVTTGAEDDADVADFLDVAALDPSTRGVILQLGSIRGGRKFMSAARACARVKPVVVLQSRASSEEGRTTADPVRSAAFARAGLVESETLDGVFDALSALARIPARSQTRVLALGNGAGVCALGLDAVLRYGLTPSSCSDESLAYVQTQAPRARRLDRALDLGPTEPQALARICQRLLDDDSIDYLLLVHSPSVDSPHEPCVAALRDAHLDPRLVTVWLGLKTASTARTQSVEAGLSTFVTAGQAARALRYRWLHGRTRELLMQTPPTRAQSARDRNAAHRIVAAAIAAGHVQLDGETAQRFVACYGMRASSAAGAGDAFDLELCRHPELGEHLTITAVGGVLRSTTARGFAPLDVLLARRMIEDMQLTLDGAQLGALATRLHGALLNLSDIALEHPSVRTLRVRCTISAEMPAPVYGDATVDLDPVSQDERRRLVLAPYPEVLSRTLTTRDERRYHMRAVRPEDEPALIQLLERMRPEDVRLRFFATIRRFSHEMVARMTQVDYDRELVLVTEPEGMPGALCSVAQLILDPYGEAGEFSILVEHAHAGRGLGRMLMEELLAHGRRCALTLIYGDILRQNTPMLTLAEHLGFEFRPHEDPDCRRVELALPPRDEAAPVDRRHRWVWSRSGS
ncbi:bifunctional acetate--CoA ligase family protein/GNAT family N-acetyltransferase [Solimonas marina]|uniref:Bifunctional acetate--CoA ligase family protein/GNAT family N-acetyltransferase n=1 Tax=Solimonas marina TaxID=2714601 RepID=A0A969WA64_9GAMM|nr:GNAT family N-acetyltransferase [Solimonas marina]NKF23492.1 bifunctional acetate--CoA ligase family protein/GNAT family N-acetyltransferase [Solimonas marina]